MWSVAFIAGVIIVYALLIEGGGMMDMKAMLRKIRDARSKIHDVQTREADDDVLDLADALSDLTEVVSQLCKDYYRDDM